MNFNILSKIYPSNDGLIKSYNPLILFDNVIFENKFDYYTNDFSLEFLDEVPKNRIVFNIYESICKKYDEPFYKESYLKNSLFVIPNGSFGREFSKTSSLTNKKNGDNYNVLFEVLSGDGYFVLESLEKVEISLISVKKGDMILVPKEHSFVIINSSEKESLVCFSLSHKKSKFEIGALSWQYGASLYYTKNGFVKNKNASPKFKLNEFNGDYIKDYNFDKELGLYKESKKIPEKFEFLR